MTDAREQEHGEHERARQRMIVEQLRSRGIHDERVLEAMASVQREAFVVESERPRAYADNALPIGLGQTISQPYMVARVSELARITANDVVLEVGLGSGYQAAVLSRLAKRVVAIELLPALAQRAATALRALGIDNVEVHTGDGSRGYEQGAPYDAIVVSAGAPRIPNTLVAQLAFGGRLVIPISAGEQHVLTRVERTAEGLVTTQHDPCMYVPLRRVGGWLPHD